MKKLALLFTVLGAAILVFLPGAPAQAQASRTWVSGVGDDANPCSRTAPCKTFAGAISKTHTNGYINCLDPGGFGAVTITKAITIDCHEVFASVLSAGTNGINIAASNAVVVLRNLNINGFGEGIHGINITSARAVFIEDCLIEGVTQHGIYENRNTGGSLFVTNTTIRNNGIAGLNISQSGGNELRANLTRVVSQWNSVGLSAANGARIVTKDSIFSGNITNVRADTGGEGVIRMDGGSISNGALGILQNSGGVIWLSNVDVFNNDTGISGTINSFGNNRFIFNGAGGTIQAIGSTSNPTGQQ